MTITNIKFTAVCYSVILKEKVRIFTCTCSLKFSYYLYGIRLPKQFQRFYGLLLMRRFTERSLFFMANAETQTMNLDPRTPLFTKADRMMYIHSAIGFAIMAIFWLAPAAAPLTPIGMKLVGIFLGMVYLWSTVSCLWPCVLGLFLIGLSGFAGQGFAGMKAVVLTGFGNDTVVMMLFIMVLFGAMDEVGCTQYIARWFLTRKIITGRPFAFLAVFYLGCYVLSTLVSPITSLLLLWPVSLKIMKTLGVERTDKIWPIFFVGMFFISAIGMPFFPFLSAQLVVLSAFDAMTKGTMPVPYLPYMALNFIMSMLLIVTFLGAVKFIFRPDISKLKAIDAERIAEQEKLPPMNIQQKIMMAVLPTFILMLLAPSFLPKSLAIVKLLGSLGTIGVAMFWIAILCFIRIGGKPIINFKEVAYRQLSWDVFFLVAAAVYAANAISHESTGVNAFVIQLLNPILGDASEMVFVAILFTAAIVLTNFANNAAMAIILMPIILAFCGQLGLPPIPIAMGVTQLVFLAMLTPAACPHASMMFGRKDIYEVKDIMKYGFPMVTIGLLYFIFIGYPLAKFLFGA